MGLYQGWLIVGKTDSEIVKGVAWQLHRLSLILTCGLLLQVIEDLREECSKYGQVLKVVVPRPPVPQQAYTLFNQQNYGKVCPISTLYLSCYHFLCRKAMPVLQCCTCDHVGCSILSCMCLF